MERDGIPQQLDAVLIPGGIVDVLQDEFTSAVGAVDLEGLVDRDIGALVAAVPA